MFALARGVAGLALVLSVTATLAQAPTRLPNAVRKEIGVMMKTCQDAGGKTAKSPGLLTVADLTGDGKPDYIIDQSAFVCEGAASMFSGSGGSQMLVYVGSPDGQAKQVFSAGAHGVRVNSMFKPAKVQIMVGGPLCGQKVAANASTASFKLCWRPLVWDEHAQKMDYGPLSQIQPVK